MTTGSDRAGERTAPDLPASPVMVLVAPQMGENIGAAARAMWNFGLDRMRLVGPRDGWPNPKAVAMASGAGRLLDEAVIHETTEAAVADLDHVYATTARRRGLTKPVLAPAEAMADALDRIRRGARVGFLFGPERAGLANGDVALAGTIVSIPTNPAFSSLNLAQSVLLLAYEWGRVTELSPPAVNPAMERRPASRAEVAALTRRWEEALERAGWFWPVEKAEGMRLGLRNMLARLDLTDRDVRTLHGMIKALADALPSEGRRPGPRRKAPDGR